MKIIFSFIILIFVCAFKMSTGVFDLSITTIDGYEKPLSEYQGKKLLIVVLPVIKNAEDTNMLQVLNTLSINYKDSVTFIGIPSYEDGFNDDSLNSIMDWYHSFLSEQFIISGAMNTRKSSPYQTPLFMYLTHSEENGYFDNDVQGSGEKFFIDKSGNLYGISSPDAEFNDDIFSVMINNSK